MNYKSTWLYLCVALSLATWLPARAEAADPDPCAGKDGVDADLLDPRIAATDKAWQLQRMQSLSERGCPDATQLLGNLFRFGPELPANPEPKDIPKATSLLEQAAMGGNSFAFAELAEMALSEQMPRQAMQWTQVYLWIATYKPKLNGVAEYPGYNADLLSRATRAWRSARLDSGEIQPLLDTYLTPARQASIINAIALRQRPLPAGSRLTLANRVHAPGNLGAQSGYVLFVLEADPSGRVTRIGVESYAPSKTLVEKLKPMLDHVRLVPFEGTRVRSGVLPMVYSAR